MRITINIVFVSSSCTILFLAATAKIQALLKQAPILNLPDPVLPLFSTGQLMLLVSFVEILVICSVVFLNYQDKGVSAIMWISGLFLVYRVGLYLSPSHRQVLCPCLGNIDGFLSIDKHKMELITDLLFAYLMIGSTALTLTGVLRRVRGDANLK
jgi:hypothetical protein